MFTRRVLRLARPSQVASMANKAVRSYSAQLDQSRHSGYAARDQSKSGPLDAANPEKGKQASRDGLTGNPERVGFADQVGSQSASGSGVEGVHTTKPESAEGVSGQEDVTPPSFADAIKQKLGLGTTAGEAKQNRGGGRGVTGTAGWSAQDSHDNGKRTIHTSAMSMADKTRGQAPASSRKPKESTHAEQNEHLKHKKSSAPDSGKGNAGPNPTLPSRQAESPPKSGASQQRRGLATSARASSEHSADSYFKEVDTSKPSNPKVHQVDASSDAPPVARANEKTATGEFSREGSQTKAYETTNKQDKPYDTPPANGPKADQMLGYGGVSEKNQTSKTDGGPEGKDAGGRKPEGRP